MIGRLNHPWVDERAAPLYLWRVPPEPSSEALGEALEAIQAWVPGLDGPYGWINDPRHLRVRVVASQRKMVAEHLRVVQSHAGRWCAGMATIVTHPAIRGIGTAVGWVTPYRFPVEWCADLEEAWTWARERLMDRGVQSVPSVPPRDLREDRRSG